MDDVTAIKIVKSMQGQFLRAAERKRAKFGYYAAADDELRKLQGRERSDMNDAEALGRVLALAQQTKL